MPTRPGHLGSRRRVAACDRNRRLNWTERAIRLALVPGVAHTFLSAFAVPPRGSETKRRASVPFSAKGRRCYDDVK